jgi:hypothetical protein
LLLQRLVSSVSKFLWIKDVKIQGEIASDNTTAADAFPIEFKKVIEEEGYSPKQIFNVEETGFILEVKAIKNVHFGKRKIRAWF